MKHTLLSLLLFYFILTSCDSTSSSNTGTADVATGYELVKVDSIMVESLEQLQITDYSPSKDLFLVYATRTKKCMEIDSEGNIISEVDLNGEGPGHFGPGITELGYMGEDIIINGPFMYLTYEGDWNFKERIPYESGGAFLPLGMISGSPETALINGEEMIFKPIDHDNFGGKKLENDYFSNANLIEAISISNEASELKLRYPKESIYQSQETFYSSHKAKISINLTQQELHVAFPLEPNVYVYNVADFSLSRSYDLALNLFKKPQGIPFEDQHKNGRRGFGPSNQQNTVYLFTNSAIYNISSEGDITIIEYTTGTKGESNLTNVDAAMALNRKEAKVYTAFFKNGEKIAEVEERFNHLVRLDEYRFLAHYVNREEELDYSKFYIYELQQTN